MASNVASLLPYTGEYRAQHFDENGRGGHSRTTYGADETGLVTYDFNALGFRGEELDPDAKTSVFACGCSYTFGVALPFQETWPHLFRAGLAAHLGLAAEQVSLLNLSQGGASNDYVARMLTTQTARARPGVVAALFTHAIRFEAFTENGWRSVGPWALDRAEDDPATLTERQRQVVQIAVDHYRHFTPATAYARALQTIVFVQSFLKARAIPHVVAWVEHTRLEELEWRCHPAVGPLVELVDRATFCAASPMDPDLLVDRAVDGRHPGPRTHAAFADRMLQSLLDGPYAGAL
jgi:hypothetical protein